MIITKSFFDIDDVSSNIIGFLSKNQINQKIVLHGYIRENLFEWLNRSIVDLMIQEQYIRYAIFAAEQVIDIFEKEFPDDKRPRKAIEAAKKYIEDPSEENKNAARTAAHSAAYSDTAAWSAWYTAVFANGEVQNKIIEYGLKLLEIGHD